MKKHLYVVALCLFLIPNSLFSQCPESFHDFTALDIHGDTIDMSIFAGKKILVVNTASFCGYTYQYGELESLYQTYGGSDFEIIGFPANNFGNQEPYDEDSIIQVCNSYNVTFTMMSKISVKGADMDPIYQWLTSASHNCVQNSSVAWNFQKYMVNADGTYHAYASSSASPNSATIVNWINAPTSVKDISAAQLNDIVVYQSDNSIVVKAGSDINETLSISLYNMAGQKVSNLYKGKLSTETVLPFSSNTIKRGMYIVEISGEGVLTRKKLILM